MATTTVDSIPPLTRGDAARLAAAEYERGLEQYRSLDVEDWRKPTDCPLWDVRAMAGHSVGMMGDFTSLRSVVTRMRAATKAAEAHGGRCSST